MGPRNHVLHVGAWRPGFPPREGALLKVILGHAQTCLRSIFLSLFVRGGGQEQCRIWLAVTIIVVCLAYLNSIIHDFCIFCAVCNSETRYSRLLRMSVISVLSTLQLPV